MSDLQRSMLDYLAERLPDGTPQAVVEGVFARGLAVLVDEERRRERPRQLVASSSAIKLFPNRFRLLLTEHERLDLDELYNLDTVVDDEVEPLHKAIAAGIHALQQVAKKRDPTQPTRIQLEANKRSVAQTTCQKGVHPANRASTQSDENEASWVACPISDKLRGKFESYLDAHPDLDETSALARLLERGLQGAEHEPGVVEADQPIDERSELSRNASAARRRRMRRRAMLQTVCAG
jgi:hypothetical protein